jgi:hypothetical protein
MGMRYSVRSAMFLPAAALALFASTAESRELVWQGNQNTNWDQGIDPKTGDSNWYTQAGKPFRAPTGSDFAIFPPGPARTIVNVTNDGEDLPRMRFESPEPYKLNIRSFSTLFDEVTATDSGTLPKVTIFEGKTLVVRGKAGFIAHPESAQILVKPGATLRFTENAAGVDGKVINHGGVVDFDNESSTGAMTIRNLSHAPPFLSLVRFYGNSRGDALFINNEGAMLDFSVGRERNSARGIDNDGNLAIGNRSVRVALNFRQGASGHLFIDVADGKLGDLRAMGGATIGGRLTITGAHTLTPATYTIIQTIARPRNGTFSEVTTPGGRIAYGANRVVLIVDPPP